MAEPYKKITRLHKTIRRRMEKAILDFNMIEKGDRILIGVSGGPDSLSLLHLMHELPALVPSDFSVVAVHIDLGFENHRESMKLASHFKELSVDFRIVQTQIKKHALKPDARKNPCFICSLYRRKEIYEIAHQKKCTKIAYGHHKDDIIETLLINILYGRKIEAMNPVQEVFEGKIHIIRPFAYVEEEMLKKFAREQNLPTLHRLCPMDGNTRRQKIKEMIQKLQQTEKNANIRENIFKSLYHINLSTSSFVNQGKDE